MQNNDAANLPSLGPYRILGRIGSGGTSTVFQARNPEYNRVIAFKLLSQTRQLDETWSARFRREIKVVMGLQHPNIVPILDYGEVDGGTYLVMPYYEKGSLEKRIALKEIGPKEGAKVVEQITSALGYLHEQGIVHRDIKPHNILFDEEDNALLADFGLAQVPDATVSLTGSEIIGTPAYISPEQAIGEKATPLSDQYSFGILLFEMLTGRLPFRGEATPSVLFKHVNDPLPSPREIQPNISEPLENVIRKATAKRPAHRFESIRALNKTFQQALEHTLDPKNNPAPKIKLPDPETSTLLFSSQELSGNRRQRRWRRWALLALLALLLGTLAFALWPRGPQELAAGAGTPSATMTGDPENPEGTNGTEAGLLAIAETATATISPTPSDTPANAATEAVIATTLAAPTATNTPTPVEPSATTGAGSTASPTLTRTFTPAPSATATQTPTATATTAPTATSPPPTATPTTSGGLNCTLILFGSMNVSGSQVRWSITNSSLQSVTISQITLNWPGSNGTLEQATLAGTTIWNQGDGSPPTSMTSWTGGSGARTINVLQSKNLAFHWDGSAAGSGYAVTVRFSNGCEVGN